MPPKVDVEKHLEELRLTTKALREAADTPEAIRPLLDIREQQIRALTEVTEPSRWTASQRAKLKSLIEEAGDIRKPLALHREILRNRLDELRTAKRAQALITPHRECGPRHLNVKL